MSEHKIKIRGGTNIRLPTAGKYCENDIVVVASDLVERVPYDGPYEITPKTEEQILPTEMKLLEQNLRIKQVPYAEVSNNTGGKTVTIG